MMPLQRINLQVFSKSQWKFRLQGEYSKGRAQFSYPERTLKFFEVTL